MDQKGRKERWMSERNRVNDVLNQRNKRKGKGVNNRSPVHASPAESSYDP